MTVPEGVPLGTNKNKAKKTKGRSALGEQLIKIQTVERMAKGK